MEFFAFADIETQPAILQDVTVRDLVAYCADFDAILQVENDDHALVYCTWGEFTVERQAINGGVRFSFTDCPNALAWTLTTGFDPEPAKVVIHATINRTAHDPDFIESIESFVDSWKTGLEQRLPGN